MVKIPFQKIDIKQPIVMNNQYWTAKDFLKEFVRKLSYSIRHNVWVAVDKEMADRPNSDLPQVFQNCAKIDFQCTLKLHTETVKPQHILFNDRLREGPLWKLLGEALGEAAEGNGKVLVLFKIAYLGLFVMHNMPHPTDKPYICVPAQKAGVSNIIIEPLNQWAERNNRYV